MAPQQMYMDLRQILVILIKDYSKSDARHELAQAIAKRHGMVELLDDRAGGKYEGGDG